LDKPRVFREICRVLRPGGELYFSDIFCDRRLPPELAHDKTVRIENVMGEQASPPSCLLWINTKISVVLLMSLAVR